MGKWTTLTLGISLRIRNGRQRPLAIFHEHGYDIVPVRVLGVRARPPSVELHPERRDLSSPEPLLSDLVRRDDHVLVRLGVGPPLRRPLALFEERAVLHLERGKRQRPLAPLGEVLGRVVPKVGAEPVLAPAAGWRLRLGCPEGEAAGRLADRLPDLALRFVAQAFEQGG